MLPHGRQVQDGVNMPYNLSKPCPHSNVFVLSLVPAHSLHSLPARLCPALPDQGTICTMILPANAGRCKGREPESRAVWAGQKRCPAMVHGDHIFFFFGTVGCGHTSRGFAQIRFLWLSAHPDPPCPFSDALHHSAQCSQLQPRR